MSQDHPSAIDAQTRARPTLKSDKCVDLDALEQIAQDCQRRQKTLVWANGFFEILHAGHIEFLMKAARLGDVLIVGLNSDASTRQLRGPGHPVTTEAERVWVLSAVERIHFITVYDDPDCSRILERIRPDVYAKGLGHIDGDIHPEERRIMQELGGTIALIAGDPAKRTDALIQRIRGNT